jgi:sulfur-oxidizing protein SoxZ
MSNDIKPRLRVPEKAKKGEVVEIKTLITHPMENGQRKDDSGKVIPRLIVNSLDVTFNGKPVMSAKLEPAVAANPFMAFFLKVEESGTLKFTWTDDTKESWSAEAKIEVA